MYSEFLWSLLMFKTRSVYFNMFTTVLLVLSLFGKISISKIVLVDEECKNCKNNSLVKENYIGDHFGVGEVNLFCKDESKLAIIWSYYGTEVDFSVDYRTLFNRTWHHSQIVHEPRAVIQNLSGGYIFRVTPYKRFSNVTQEARESPTLFTLSSTTPLSRINSANIKINVTFEKHLSAILSWEPVKELVCGYNIIIWRVGYETYEKSPMIEDLYEVVLQNLIYSTEYQIGIHAITEKHEGPKYWIHYVTPSCAEKHDYDYAYCAPEKPRNFTVYLNKCILYLSWEAPPKLPDLYFLRIQALLSITVEDFRISGDKNNFTVDTSRFTEDLQITFFAMASSKKGDEIVDRIMNQCTTTKKKRDYTNSYLDNFTSGVEIKFIIFAIIFMVVLLIIFFLSLHRTTVSCDTSDTQSATKQEEKYEIQRFEEVSNTETMANEINSSMLIIQEIVGKGEFGIVSKAVLNISEKEIEVAVKSIRRKGIKEDEECFNSELEVMRTVGKHKNLVSLVGYCTSEKLLIVEYCALGDLQNFLREARKTKLLLQELASTSSESCDGLITQIVSAHLVSNMLYERSDIEKKHLELSTIDLLTFARQIANGMEYLSTNKIIHRDLAARNILLTYDLTAKISDFGLSRDIYLESVYRKKHISKLPIKWMAPESLSHQLFTTQSDVWSFGILLWEIMTLGGTPYPSTPSGMIYKLIKSGYRMEKPPSCSQDLYEIMTSCWNGVPQRRPTFSNIILMLDKVLNDKSMHGYVDLDSTSINYACNNSTADY